jgi:hypothetical protein
LREGAIKAVEHVQQRQYDLALVSSSDGLGLTLNAPAIIVKVGQRSQIHIMLLAKRGFEEVDFG